MTVNTSQGGGKPVNTTAVSETQPEKYLKVRGGVKKLNPEFVALWEPYFEEGYSHKAIGEIFGVARSTVRTYYPDKAWSHEQVIDHAITMRQHNRKMRKVSYA